MSAEHRAKMDHEDNLAVMAMAADRLHHMAIRRMDEKIREVIGLNPEEWAAWQQAAREREARDRTWPRRWLVSLRRRRRFVEERIGDAVDVLRHGRSDDW